MQLTPTPRSQTSRAKPSEASVYAGYQDFFKVPYAWDAEGTPTCQHFCFKPAWKGGLTLFAKTPHGPRSMGQAPFPTREAGAQWAASQCLVNGYLQH